MKNLYSLIAFLVVSIIAFSIKDISLFEISNEYMRCLLGTPPPAFLITIALSVYAISAGFLKWMDIVNDKKPEFKLSNLSYRITFYIFYSFSGAIAANFLPVLIVGLILYGMDQFHVVRYESEHKGLLV